MRTCSEPNHICTLLSLRTEFLVIESVNIENFSRTSTRFSLEWNYNYRYGLGRLDLNCHVYHFINDIQWQNYSIYLGYVLHYFNYYHMGQFRSTRPELHERMTNVDNLTFRSTRLELHERMTNIENVTFRSTRPELHERMTNVDNLTFRSTRSELHERMTNVDNLTFRSTRPEVH